NHNSGKLEIIPVFVKETRKENLLGISEAFVYPEELSAALPRHEKFSKIWMEVKKLRGVHVDVRNPHDLEVLSHRIERCLFPAPSTLKLTVVSEIVSDPPYFIGRDTILTRMNRTFSNCKINSSVLLHGYGGSGKTWIGSKYAWKAKSLNQYTHVLWIDFHSLEDFTKSMDNTSRLLGINLEDESFESRKQATLRWLSTFEGYLVILDNVNDSKLVGECLEGLPKFSGHVIITSRSLSQEQLPNCIQNSEIHCEKVDGFQLEESLEYCRLRLSVPISAGTEEDDLRVILKILDGRPREIEQMCSFLNSIKSSNVSEYVEHLRNRYQNGLNDDSGGDALEGVRIASSFLLQKGRKGCCVALGAISCVLGRNIPVHTYLERYLMRAGYETEDMEEIILPLIHMSLITLEFDNKISVHAAIQNIIRSSLPHTHLLPRSFDSHAVDVMRELIACASDTPKLRTVKSIRTEEKKLNEDNEISTDEKFTLSASRNLKQEKSLSLVTPMTSNDENVEMDNKRKISLKDGEVLLPHIYHLSSICSNRTFALANLCYEAAKFAEFIGNYNSAKNLCLRARDLYIELHLSREHPDVASAIHLFGNIANHLGLYEEAKICYSECLEILKKVYNTNLHPKVADTLNNLGSIYYRQGQYECAGVYFAECLDIKLILYGSELHPSVANSIANLANIATSSGNYKRAKELYTKCLEIYEKVFGTKMHSTISDVLTGLGLVANNQGEYEAASEYFTDSLEIKVKVFGTKQHASVADALNNLGNIALKQGKYDDALNLFLECLEIKDKVYGTRQHASIANTINNLGMIADIKGNYEEAKNLYRECVDIYEKVYRTRFHANVAMTLNNLGLIAGSQGNYDEAKKLYSECLEIYKKVYGTVVHFNVAMTLKNLVITMANQNEYNEAKKRYSECEQIYKLVYETDLHPDILRLLGDLGKIADSNNYFYEAKEFLFEFVKKLHQYYETEYHRDVAEALNGLGLICEKMGDFAEARAYFIKCIQICDQLRLANVEDWSDSFYDDVFDAIQRINLHLKNN
ncbi:hypothetical protein HK098_007456, partial [Nowakowskiella sp. JEL0407]